MTKKIFPTNVYTDEKSKEAKEKIQDFYDTSISQNSVFWQEADTDSLIEAGDQKVLNNLGFNRVLPYMDMYTSNKVKRMINLVSGVQRRGRNSTKCIPLEGSDQKTADQFTKIIYNINNNYSVLDVISDAFQSALITGLSLMQLWVDYREDPISGTIKVDVCPYNTFIIDPNFKKPDLSDCNVIWKRSYLTEAECKSLLPEHKTDIEELSKAGTGSDDLFPSLTTTSWINNDLLSYDEYYYKDYRTKKTLIDTVTGEMVEYTGQDNEILPLFLQKNPAVILREIDAPTVRLAILVNGQVFYDGLNPIGIDRYPFVPVFAYLNQQVNDMYLKFQGLPRGMRDSQFLYNLATSLEVEYIQSRVNPGIIYKPTSLIDQKAVERRDLSAGMPIHKNASMDDVRFVNPMDIPQSIPLIREQAAKEIIENDGGNEELLGSAVDDKAGILSMLRQGSGLTILQPLFDSLDRSQKILGQIELLSIQSNYTPGKIKRIIEDEPTEQFYNKTFGKYDCVVEEGVNTSTQRQEQFATMVALKEKGIINIPDELLIKASTMQNKQELIDYMNNMAKQQAQAQQKETEITAQLQQAETNLANSRAAADMGLAQERLAKIEDNRTQAIANLAEANKDDEQATLDKIKALKELETIDFANLERLIRLVNTVKLSEQASKVQLGQTGLAQTGLAQTGPVQPGPVQPEQGQTSLGQTSLGQPSLG